MRIPNALVVSADESICGTLGEVLLRCCVAPVFAEPVRAAARDIRAGNLSVIISQDVLGDGSYEDLLRVQRTMGISLPLIVISVARAIIMTQSQSGGTDHHE